MAEFIFQGLVCMAGLGGIAFLHFAIRVWEQDEEFHTTKHEVTK